MSEGYYPRVETIEVPDNVRAEYIGKYVNAEVVKLLDGIGKSSINFKSIALRPLSRNFYVLSFDSNQPYALPKELDIRKPDQAQPGIVEAARLATGNKAGLGKVNRTGGA
jgi:hypothetical protein